MPTRRADLLFEEIERYFHGIDAINDYCDRLRDTTQRTIAIAAVPVLSVALLPRVIRCYREAVHRDFFVIHSRATEQVVSWVSSQKVDLGFALQMAPIPGVKSEVIAQFRGLCLLPPGHRLEGHAVVTPADLEGVPMITLSHAEGVADLVARAFAPKAPLPQAVVECAMATAVCAMVEAGIGFTILDPVSAFPFRELHIIVKPFAPDILFAFCAYWLPARRLSFDRPRLLKLAHRHLAEIGAHFRAAGEPSQ